VLAGEQRDTGRSLRGTGFLVGGFSSSTFIRGENKRGRETCEVLGPISCSNSGSRIVCEWDMNPPGEVLVVRREKLLGRNKKKSEIVKGSFRIAIFTKKKKKAGSWGLADSKVGMHVWPNKENRDSYLAGFDQPFQVLQRLGPRKRGGGFAQGVRIPVSVAFAGQQRSHLKRFVEASFRETIDFAGEQGNSSDCGW